jgi:pimeloyl-ACP methyl ester carboxylesterase
MPRIKTNGMRIEYESFGPVSSEPILLIAGLGEQLTQWPRELCDKLVESGYRVIRFDNRDSGLSSKATSGNTLSYSASLAALAEGKSDFAVYSLNDMAKDAVGLLDVLKIQSAHIVGVAMGGMIAQKIASDFPARTLSLTSIMSTTGNPDLPPPNAEVQKLLLSPAPVGSDLHGIISRRVELQRLIGSPDYPVDAEAFKEHTMNETLRSYYPAGLPRQLAAVMESGDRRAELAEVTAPTVVLHGEADTFIPLAAGEDTAKAIPGAELRKVPGMGHDLPLALIDTIAEAITAAAKRGQGRAPTPITPAQRVEADAPSGLLARLIGRFRRAQEPLQA